MKSTLTATFLLVLLFTPLERATAQTIGTFRWQQQPYCNVLTLTITQIGAAYRLEGTDDGCGAPRQASVVGLAFLNPNGTVGMGLTVVTNDGAGSGGAPLHLDAAISLTSLSGTWRDNTGQTGAWVFTAAAGTGGAARPAPVLAPGIVTSAALAPSAVTSTALAPSAVTSAALADGSVTASKFNATAFNGKFFSTVVAAGLVSANGITYTHATVTTATVSRVGLGSYRIVLPGLDPGCTGLRGTFVVATPTDANRLARASGFSTISCGTGDSSAQLNTTDLAGAAADSGFTFIVFHSGS